MKYLSLVSYILKNWSKFEESARLRNMQVSRSELQTYYDLSHMIQIESNLVNSGSGSKAKLAELKTELAAVEIQKAVNSIPNFLSDSVAETDAVVLEVADRLPLVSSLMPKVCTITTNPRCLRFFDAELVSKIISVMRYNALSFGFREENVSVMCSKSELFSAGMWPAFSRELYSVDDTHFLIPTAEVKLLSLAGSSMTFGRTFSVEYAFRKEGGAYGHRDMYTRLNQFRKLELFAVCSLMDAEQELQYLVSCATHLLDLFDLGYRVLSNSGYNTSFQSNHTFDIEVWSATKQSFLEVSSCSSTGDFQSRRLSLKVNNEFPACLNGTALALERLVYVLLERYTVHNLHSKLDQLLIDLKQERIGSNN